MLISFCLACFRGEMQGLRDGGIHYQQQHISHSFILNTSAVAQPRFLIRLQGSKFLLHANTYTEILPFPQHIVISVQYESPTKCSWHAKRNFTSPSSSLSGSPSFFMLFDHEYECHSKNTGCFFAFISKWHLWTADTDLSLYNIYLQSKSAHCVDKEYFPSVPLSLWFRVVSPPPHKCKCKT